MKCHDARKWISPYIDSELDPTKTFELSQHLEDCEACKTRFDQEALADGLIAKSLQRHESFVDWSAIEKEILAPPRYRMPIRPKWLLAAAACIAFLLISLGDWSGPTLAEWAAEELHQLRPDCQPFPGGPSCTLDDVASLVSEVLDREVSMPTGDGLAGGHGLTLTKASLASGAAGSGRVRIQLNCCGHPVLVIIGRRGDQGPLAELTAGIDAGGGQYRAEIVAHSLKYNVRAAKKGDYIIIAVSPHQIDHVVSAFQPTAD